MIIGAHSIIYSTDAEADRAFLRDVLGLTHVDIGHGWLILGLPPAELAVHPGDAGAAHEFYFMCDDLTAFMAQMKTTGRDCSTPTDHNWGLLTNLTLPSGAKVGVYQPKHPRPEAMA